MEGVPDNEHMSRLGQRLIKDLPQCLDIGIVRGILARIWVEHNWQFALIEGTVRSLNANAMLVAVPAYGAVQVQVRNRVSCLPWTDLIDFQDH